MCLAIYRPSNTAIKKRALERGFTANPDGAGLAYAHKGTLHIVKGLMTFPAFWSAYERIPSSAPAVIHFRIGTSGLKDEANCHPFPLLNGRACVIHNGVLFYPHSEKRSDTSHFSAEILDPLLAHNLADSHAVRHVIESTIGPSNKMVVLYESGHAVIYHKDRGTERKGVWYSNTSFEAPARYESGSFGGRPWYVSDQACYAGRSYGASAYPWYEEDDTEGADAGPDITCDACHASFTPDECERYGQSAYCPFCFEDVSALLPAQPQPQQTQPTVMPERMPL